MAADGLTTMRSSYGPKGTINRLEANVRTKGVTVFARASIMRQGPRRLEARWHHSGVVDAAPPARP